MPKYYYSKSETNVPANTEYGLISNQSDVYFYRNSQRVKTLSKSGAAMPSKGVFTNLLGTDYTKFFNGDKPAGTSIENNAFAYMRSNGVEGNKF